MSKKSFTGGINSLLGENTIAQTVPAKTQTEATAAEPAKTITKPEPTSSEGIRATFIVNKNLLEKVKGIAYWERSSIKEVVNEALEIAVKNYEQSRGEVKNIPSR